MLLFNVQYKCASVQTVEGTTALELVFEDTTSLTKHKAYALALEMCAQYHLNNDWVTMLIKATEETMRQLSNVTMMCGYV